MSFSTPPFSSSLMSSLNAGTFIASVLYNLEYLARVPSAVRASARRLRASGSCVNNCFISSKLIFSRTVGLGTTRTISPPLEHSIAPHQFHPLTPPHLHYLQCHEADHPLQELTAPNHEKIKLKTLI
nr:hypothetical protein Itr_chr11CG04300 [Ipomoea trifida]